MSGPQGYDPTQSWQPQPPGQGEQQPQPGGAEQPGWQQPGGESPTMQTSGWQQPGADQGATQMASWETPAYTPPSYQPPAVPSYQPPQVPQQVPQQYPAVTQAYPGTDQYAQQAAGYGQPAQYGQYGQQPGQPGFPPTYGQQLPGQPDQGAKKSHAKLFTILGVAAGLVVTAVLVAGFWLPGFFVTRVLDISKAQSGVADILSDATKGYGAKNVKDVKCNDGKDPEIVKDATFTCEVSIDGTKRQVTVKFLDNKEGRYEVGRPK